MTKVQSQRRAMSNETSTPRVMTGRADVERPATIHHKHWTASEVPRQEDK